MSRRWRDATPPRKKAGPRKPPWWVILFVFALRILDDARELVAARIRPYARGQGLRQDCGACGIRLLYELSNNDLRASTYIVSLRNLIDAIATHGHHCKFIAPINRCTLCVAISEARDSLR